MQINAYISGGENVKKHKFHLSFILENVDIQKNIWPAKYYSANLSKRTARPITQVMMENKH